MLLEPSYGKKQTNFLANPIDYGVHRAIKKIEGPIMRV